jgi:hypothetical protein
MGVQAASKLDALKQPLTSTWAKGSIRGSAQTNFPWPTIVDLYVSLG